jgi:hypothetical protein
MKIPQLRHAIVAGLIVFAASTAAAFNSGDRVQCTGNNVNVRTSTDTSSNTNVIGQVNSGDLGTFQSGPTSSGGHQWYYVKWDKFSQAGYTADFVAAASIPAPSLNSISPNPVTGSNSAVTFTLSGSNFVNGAKVQVAYAGNNYTFVNTNTNATYVNSSTLTVPITTQPQTDTWNVRVQNPDGQLSGQINLVVNAPASNPAPTLNSISPNPVTGSNSAVTFTLSGSNFVSGAKVQVAYAGNNYTFVNTNTNATYVNSSTLTVPITTQPQTDTWNVRVQNPDGQLSGQINLVVNAPASNPAPTLSSISPNPVTGSNSAVMFTLSGSNFVSGAKVQVAYAGNNYTFVNTNTNATYVNSSTLTVPITTQPQADTWNVRVQNPDGQLSGQINLVVNAPASNPAPTLNSISPNPVTGSNSAVTFTLSGSNFVSGAKVQVAYAGNNYTFVNTNSNATYVNSSTLTVPITTQPQTDTWKVRVQNPDGQLSGQINLVVNAPGSGVTPSISSIAPGSVTGSNNYQVFTINGANFVNGATVQVGFHDNNYTWQSTSSLPTFVSSSQMTIQIKTGLTADTWNVRIQNPDGQTSNTVNFTVTAQPQPDLVPSQVTVTPSSFILGTPVTVSFRVTNQGNGDAVASKTRLRITTSATTTSPNDVSLGDVSTPVVPAGQFVTLTPSLTVSGVAAGTYYIWASVDNTNVTNQSDGTNDYAHSAAVTITAPGLTPPSVQSVNQVPNSDGTVTLTAVATGSSDLRYQWTKDNQPLGGAIYASTKVGLSGDYVINLTNGAGTASGLTHVSANSTPIIAAQPSGGLLKTLYPSSTPNPNWPTVVITHGWQPCVNPEGDTRSPCSTQLSDWRTPPCDITQLADAIHLRLPNVNILAYVWKDAYVPRVFGCQIIAGPAYAARQWAGNDLAQHLLAALPNYDTVKHPIQFVGHSFGTFVNAYAIAKLPSWHIQQCTLLDAPINAEAWAGVQATSSHWLSGGPSADIFYENLLPQQVDWVDNYIAGLPYRIYDGGAFVLDLGQVGGLVSGSQPQAPRDGEWVGTVDHGTIVPNFYTPTVSLHNGDGFDHSAVVRGGTSDLSKWKPGSKLDRALDNLISSGIAKLGISYIGVDLVGSAFTDIWRLVTQSSGSSQSLMTAQQASSDSSIQFYVGVPVDAKTLRFDFLFPQLGNGDWMSVEFNDKTVFTFLGTAFFGSDYDHAEIPVSNIIGQAGVFTVTLHAASSTPAELRLANFHFESRPPASLVSPLTGAAITFPQTFSWSLDQSYSAKVYVTATPNAKPGVDPIAVSTEVFAGSGSLSVDAGRWTNIVSYLGPAQIYYWTVGDANLEDGIFAGWQPITVAPTVLGNISTRLSVRTGDSALIGGFIITGTQPKKVIVRGIGPSLVSFGLSGVLADPMLELHDSSQVIGTNDDWQTNANKQEMIDRNVAPSNPKEAAILTTLNPGTYTAILRGASNGTGIGTVEVYDLDQAVDSKLANISTRGFVDTGDNVMIGGTIITGAASANVLIRAIGPSLTNFGVPNALQDPTLELHNAQGGTIASNDNWVDSPDAAAISATTLQPTNSHESAILQNLAPGAYTAVVRGSGNSTGVALVEAYQLP